MIVQEAPAILQLAEELLATCIALYDRQPTGLAPEAVRFEQGGVIRIESPRYLLRPETVRSLSLSVLYVIVVCVLKQANNLPTPVQMESIFYLHRATANPVYREAGWRIFQSIERHCRTASAYSGLLDVTLASPTHDNSMQSFFMAETIKYAFLLFSPGDVLPLDRWVLTTEAHPLPVIASAVSS
jgi:mannosyl-oligosaccharide alpha-1,2-mannosidase